MHRQHFRLQQRKAGTKTNAVFLINKAVEKVNSRWNIQKNITVQHNIPKGEILGKNISCKNIPLNKIDYQKEFQMNKH